MLSVPIAAHHGLFKWQLDLFWFAHQAVYGDKAKDKALAAIVTQNAPTDQTKDPVGWGFGVPFVAAAPYYEQLNFEYASVRLPLNIQTALSKVLERVSDDQMLEVLDCDMYHFKPAPELQTPDDVLLVATAYEPWHLKSLTDNKGVIDCYFENQGRYYNGGFVPIIGRARTFKRIMYEWIAVHVDILKRDLPEHIHWWAGMFALQAACEKAKVTMVSHDVCAIAPEHPLRPNHYITHYSVDPFIGKRTFPAGVDLNRLPDQPQYNLFKLWFSDRYPGS
jgi:hypothetical protein